MSDRSVACPTCGVHRLKPHWPSVQTTPWTDECGCSDRELCMYHRFNFSDQPERPPDEQLQARAAARHERALEDWKAEQVTFRETAALKERVADLERVLRIIVASNSLSNQAYVRHDGDDVSIIELIDHSLGRG